MTKQFAYNVTHLSKETLEKVENVLKEEGYSNDYRINYFNEEKEVVVFGKNLKRVFKIISKIIK